MQVIFFMLVLFGIKFHVSLLIWFANFEKTLTRCGKQSQESISSFSMTISELLRLKVCYMLALLYDFTHLYSFGPVIYPYNVKLYPAFSLFCDIVTDHVCTWCPWYLAMFPRSLRWWHKILVCYISGCWQWSISIW